MPKLKWAGELRLRAQPDKAGDNDTRWIERLRLRLGVLAQIEPELKAEIRLMTAHSQRSGNQNLGDSADGGPARRFIGLDLAYIEWNPLFFFKASGGRLPQSQYRAGGSQMVLDENVVLEGASAVVDYNLTENLRTVLAAGSVIVRENYDDYYSQALSDNMINWTQLRGEFKMARYRAVVGGGFFNFTSLQGKNFSDIVSGGAANGNSQGAIGVIKYPYLPKQYFAEVFYPLALLDSSLFVERVINDEAPTNNSAWYFGATLGQQRWDASVAYLEIKPDAVFSPFTWDDFGGGGTDSRGIVAAGRWRFKKGMIVKVTELVNRLKASTDNKEHERTHIELTVAF